MKIIKLKKPRITPLTALMMDESDEMDDRSPPPPPPGSPPPPSMWPSYLVSNDPTGATTRPSATASPSPSVAPVQAPAPPTPFALLQPPPPLNYTILESNKA